MEFVILMCFSALLSTVHTSVVKTHFVNSLKTIYEARDYCQTFFNQGSLADSEDIVNTVSGEVWDGNLYKLSSLIAIKGCTFDPGHSQHTLTSGLHWSDAAAQCQVQCDTVFYAIRGTTCDCFADSFTTVNDLFCVSMLKRSPSPNDEHPDAKVIFETVMPLIGSGFSTLRCFANTQSERCQSIEFRDCGDQLPMKCRGAATSIAASWEDAGFACAAANVFPRPPVVACTSGPATWLAGFRRLQYANEAEPRDIFICKSLNYSNINDIPTSNEVNCDDKYPFYCRYTELGYNVTCDPSRPTSCDPTFVCSLHGGTPRCLCHEEDYFDVNNTICRTKAKYNEDCKDEICEDSLVCQFIAEEYRCLCDDNSYWNSTEEICETARDFNQSCMLNLPDSCMSNMICGANSTVCGCHENEFWEAVEQSCFEINQYNGSCFPGSDESCIADLKCQKVSDGDSRCLCDQGALYLDTTCQYGSFSAVIVTKPMTFYEADEACSTRFSYLADDNNFERIFKDCLTNTALFQTGIKQPGFEDSLLRQCTTVQLVNGSIQRDTYSNCSSKLPFVCIEKDFEFNGEKCRIFENLIIPPNRREKEKHDPFLGIILACAGSLAVIIALVISAVCIKRRKKTQPNNIKDRQDTTFINLYDSVKSCDLNPDREIKKETDDNNGVLSQKPEEDMYSHTRLHEQESDYMYDTFAKPDNDFAGTYDSMQNLKLQEGSEYEKMGTRVPGISQDHTYSHTKHSQNVAEYETFKNSQFREDTGVVYDSTHKMLKENPYDRLTKTK